MDYKSKRINLIDHKNFSVELEYTEEVAILHLPYVEKFNKTIYQLLREKLEELVEFFNTIGYQGLWVALVPEDETNNKFVKKFGFEFVGNFDGLNVYHRKES